MNMHVRSPETGNERIPSGLLAQERARQETLKQLAKLRREARDEIDRLLAFLDASDTYVTSELEENGDEADASYPTDGRHVANPMEDDEEDGAESEPSLGAIEDHSNGYYDGTDANGRGRSQARWANSRTDDCEDEHDGAEESHDREGDRADYEPSLGWTESGAFGDMQDMELA